MLDLQQLRVEIDKVDSEIIKLYEKRMELIKQVTIYKLNNNIPILDASREASMLEKNLNKIINNEFKPYYHMILDGYLSASKAMQKDLIDKNK